MNKNLPKRHSCINYSHSEQLSSFFSRLDVFFFITYSTNRCKDVMNLNITEASYAPLLAPWVQRMNVILNYRTEQSIRRVCYCVPSFLLDKQQNKWRGYYFAFAGTADECSLDGRKNMTTSPHHCADHHHHHHNNAQRTYRQQNRGHNYSYHSTKVSALLQHWRRETSAGKLVTTAKL